MKDIAGNELAVGDKVAFIPQNGYTSSLSVGIVAGLTSKKVTIDVTNPTWVYSKDRCHKFPVQVVKVFSSGV